jgi:hypothetical protein
LLPSSIREQDLRSQSPYLATFEAMTPIYGGIAAMGTASWIQKTDLTNHYPSSVNR